MPELHEVLLSAVIDVVPQWYEAASGPHQYEITVGGATRRFVSRARLTPQLTAFLDTAQSTLLPWWAAWLAAEPGQGGAAVPASGSSLFNEALALAWLRQHAPAVDWPAVLAYAAASAERTHENARVAWNLVVGAGTGTLGLADPGGRKLIDVLGGSPFAYLRVDHALRVVGYEEILWDQVREAEDYKFHPEFLHPFVCVLQPDEVSVHLTSRGDLVVLDSGGLVAARRKGAWRIYDVRTMKNAMIGAAGDYRVAATLFEVLFDLSFRRHGALLVYDPQHSVLPHVVNRSSLIGAGGDAARQLLGAAIGPIAMGQPNALLRRKRRFLELASLDGAVLFDSHRLLAVGAMIRSAQGVDDAAGARTTAARSALRHGGRAFKVSADGEITVYMLAGPGEAWVELTYM